MPQDIRRIMGELAQQGQQARTGDEAGEQAGGTTDAIATQATIRLHPAEGGRPPSGREPRGRVAALDFTLPALVIAWFESWLRGEGQAYGDGRSESELAGQYVFNCCFRDFLAQPTTDSGGPAYDTEAWALEVFGAMLKPAADAAEGDTRRQTRQQTIEDCCEAMTRLAAQGLPPEEIVKHLPAVLAGREAE